MMYDPDLYPGLWWISPEATIDEPETAVAGDTWQWVKTLPLYLASQYSLAYYFTNATNAFSIVSTGDTPGITVEGDMFLISFDSTTVVPGKYRWQAYATALASPFGRHTAVEGWLNVTPNLATGTPVDLRSQAQALLDAINSVLAGTYTSDTAKYTIGNRSLEKMSRSDLMKQRSIVAWRVFHEKRKERIANGLDDGKRAYVRFDGA